jgi:hypothetical protein
MVYTLQESQQFNTGRRRTGTTTMSTINKETIQRNIKRNIKRNTQRNKSKETDQKKHPKKPQRKHPHRDRRTDASCGGVHWHCNLGFTCTVSSLSTSPTLVKSMDTATVSQD